MLELAIKTGVKITSRHFDEPFVRVFPALLEKYPATTDGKVWITEAQADRVGFHELYRAVDVRTKNIVALQGLDDLQTRTGEISRAAARLRRRLGPDFDVDAHLELVGTPNEHIHIELDPKG